MSKQRSTLSKGRNFNAKLVRHCCCFWQQSRTLLRHCCWCGPGFTYLTQPCIRHSGGKWRQCVCVMCRCRWVKYEQTVETGGRWSKPHVSTTSMRGLNALRRAINDGECCVSLDVVPTSGEFVVAGQRGTVHRNKLVD